MVTLKTSNGYLSVETTESGEVISATHSVRLISMIWCYDLIRKNLGACPNTKRTMLSHSKNSHPIGEPKHGNNTIKKHQVTQIEIGIVGISPLLMHAWSEKALRMMTMTVSRKALAA